MLPLVLSSDSHVFEPPDLWQTRIDRAFRARAPRIERIDGGDYVVVERDQILSGIGLISNAGARFEAPETITAEGRFEDVLRGGYDPAQHLRDMALDGVAGEVLYPSQGLFYFKIAEPALMSAIFRAYNDWLAEFCRTDPARLKGVAMINLDDVGDATRELERAARLGLSGGDDHRVSSRGPALRPARIREVLGRRCRARYAIEPAYGDPAAGQDPRRRSRYAARRQQPCHQGVLSGVVAVRHDLLRRLRAPPAPDPGYRRVRALLGAQRAHLDGLHLPRAPRRGDLPVQERHAARATSSTATSS